MMKNQFDCEGSLLVMDLKLLVKPLYLGYTILTILAQLS